MANHPSAEKRNRQRVLQTERNRSVRSSVRTTVKKARSALATNQVASAKDSVAEAAKALARAASKGVIHPKAAARVTSRIESALARLGKA